MLLHVWLIFFFVCACIYHFQPPAPVVRMMDDGDSVNQSKRSVPKLKHDTTKRSTRTKQATPLVPKKTAGENHSEAIVATARSNREGLDISKLHSILRGYGEYPAKYRWVELHVLTTCTCTCIHTWTYMYTYNLHVATFIIIISISLWTMQQFCYLNRAVNIFMVGSDQ